MRKQMEQAYQELAGLLGIETDDRGRKVSLIIKKALADFTHGCRAPAVWCFGLHTQMLMTDYVFELKDVRYIIDEFCAAGEEGGGMEIIRSSQIEERQIDGIVISSFKYRKEITQEIRMRFPQINYLDIYQALQEQGIALDCEYYATGYPYVHYANINKLKMRLAAVGHETGEEKALHEALLKEYATIKDFMSASACMDAYRNIEDTEKTRKLQECIHTIYALELQAAEMISDKNVLMLCIDGLRRRDLHTEQMKKIKKHIDSRAYYFSNAYAVSTSTFESLIPAYSENSDLRTRYYEQNEVQEADCRFIREALAQGRQIYFYTDGCRFVESGHVRQADQYQTASEKIWSFLLDAAGEENGLFYVHILYESHYSYPNPYTEKEIVAEGTSIFFDFLQRNGGHLKTDYEAQHADAVRYLDDLLAPFLERISCGMVMFADHGGCVLREGERLEDVKYAQMTFGEELLQVPLAVFSKQMGAGTNDGLCSIMGLNDILICLMRGEGLRDITHGWIKAVRSEIYNADFRYLYQKTGYMQGMEAFEVFLFADGYKLAVYANGATELYRAADDERIEDEGMKRCLLGQVRGAVSVCSMGEC